MVASRAEVDTDSETIMLDIVSVNEAIKKVGIYTFYVKVCISELFPFHTTFIHKATILVLDRVIYEVADLISKAVV